MRERTVVTISLPSFMARRLNEAQNKLGFTRSELFRFIVRRQLEEIDAARLADEGGAFAFLEKEPDLYSVTDLR